MNTEPAIAIPREYFHMEKPEPDDEWYRQFKEEWLKNEEEHMKELKEHPKTIEELEEERESFEEGMRRHEEFKMRFHDWPVNFDYWDDYYKDILDFVPVMQKAEDIEALADPNIPWRDKRLFHCISECVKEFDRDAADMRKYVNGEWEVDKEDHIFNIGDDGKIKSITDSWGVPYERFNPELVFFEEYDIHYPITIFYNGEHWGHTNWENHNHYYPFRYSRLLDNYKLCLGYQDIDLYGTEEECRNDLIKALVIVLYTAFVCWVRWCEGKAEEDEWMSHLDDEDDDE